MGIKIQYLLYNFEEDLLQAEIKGKFKKFVASEEEPKFEFYTPSWSYKTLLVLQKNKFKIMIN
jgi:hypothetical protein